MTCTVFRRALIALGCACGLALALPAPAVAAAEAVWHGQRFSADNRFLMRHEGPVIAERWTWPGTISDLRAEGDGLHVDWESDGQTASTTWTPDRPVPPWVLQHWSRFITDTLRYGEAVDLRKPGALGRRIAQDPTHPRLRLMAIEAALQVKDQARADRHYQAIMASPHLTFPDWTNLTAAFEFLGQPAWADAAWQRAQKAMQATGYRPELIQVPVYVHDLFGGNFGSIGGTPFSHLSRERPERFRILIDRVAQVAPNVAGAARAWAGMAVLDPGRAAIWQERSRAAAVGDGITAMTRYYLMGSALALGAMAALWLWSLRWAMRGGRPGRAAVSLAGVLILSNGISRWTDHGWEHLGRLSLSLYSGSLASPAVRRTLREAPASPLQAQLVQWADAEAAGRPLPPIPPRAVTAALWGPLTPDHFRPWPDANVRYLRPNACETLLGLPMLTLSQDNRLALGAVTGWVLAFGLLYRRRLPRWTGLLLPGAVAPTHWLSPVAMTAWVGGGLWLFHELRWWPDDMDFGALMWDSFAIPAARHAPGEGMAIVVAAAAMVAAAGWNLWQYRRQAEAVPGAA